MNEARVSRASEGDRIDLRSLGPHALSEEIVERLGEKPFRARQIASWLHKRCAVSFEEMTDLSLELRQKLSTHYCLDTLAVERILRSADGSAKLALRTVDGHLIEVVHLPEWRSRADEEDPPGRPPDRSTLCLSTQVGCAMGCAFCRTATMGLVRNLTVGEMVDQVYRACAWLGTESGRPISNLVFMGMGEPLANYDNLKIALELLLSAEGMNFSHRHVTVSTCGLVPSLERLGKETSVKVAISLTGTTDAVRDELMPINRRWPLAELLDTCRNLPLKRGRRITFEYVLLAGRTDSLEDADRLGKLLFGIPAKVNLISYNESPNLPYRSPKSERVAAFRERLADKGLTVVVRRSRGRDIGAACGQLAAGPQP